MQRAQIGAVAIEYEVRGEGDPLLLIHGAHIADAMKPLASDPALGDFRCITFHRRGYAGSSAVTGPVGVEEHADDAAALLELLDIERAHVVGHSSGGLIALGVACRHPDLVESVVLLEAPLLDLPVGAAFVEAVRPLVARFAAGDGAGAVHDFLGAVGGVGWRTALERTVPGGLAQAERDAATFFTSELPGVGAWKFGAAEAAQLAMPVLAVLGGKSAPLFVESHRQLIAWIEGAQEALVPDATHLLQMEQPAEVARSIAAFCRTVTWSGI
jgi:pimeloyl-ACP methyl ester carboxylesterase